MAWPALVLSAYWTLCLNRYMKGKAVTATCPVGVALHLISSGQADVHTYELAEVHQTFCTGTAATSSGLAQRPSRSVNTMHAGLK